MSLNNPLVFEVVPEKCLRNENFELLLGTPINQLISSLQASSRSIRNVELIYCNKNPFERDITVTLRNDGIRLYFDPLSQLLKLIEIFDFKNIVLKFCNEEFSSPKEEASINKIELCFGATHPGVYDEVQRVYLMHWRGVSFSFPAKEPSTVHTKYAHGLGSLNFSNSSIPILQKMSIFMGNSLDKIKSPDYPPASVLCGNIYPISIASINNDRKIVGLRILFCAEEDSSEVNNTSGLVQIEKNIYFGDSEEAILCALGAPSKVYYKFEEKMLIQRGSDSQNIKANKDRPDFFFNYFTLGLDILFDFDTRHVTKFSLHTNIPGHFDFGIYNRSNFSITSQHRDNIESIDTDRNITIRNDSKLEELRDLFASKSDTNYTVIGCKPVILNKCMSALEGENPFGSTFCYGTDQLIVEIMDNSHIASLTIIEEKEALYK